MEEKLTVELGVKLDTAEAEKQLKNMSKSAGDTSLEVALPKGTKVDLPKDAKKSLKDIFTGKDGIKNIGDVAKSAVGGVSGLAGSLSSLLPALGAVAAVVLVISQLLQGTDTMKAMMEQWNTLMVSVQEIMAPLLSVIGDIVIVLLQMVESILPVLQPAIDMITFQMSLLAQVLEFIAPAIELVGKAFQFIWDILKDIIGAITFGLVNLGTVQGSTTGLKGGDMKSSLDTWETSGENKPTVGEQLIADTVAEGTLATGGFLSGLFESIKSFFQPVINVIATLLQGIWDVVKIILAPIADAIVAVLNIVASALSVIASVFNGVVGVMKSILELIQSAFGFLAGIINSIKEGINSFIIGPINWILGKIKGINILGAKPFNFIKLIQTFEDGGTLGAQVWGMNEKGNPEFMFNAGGHDTIINARILEDAMYNAYVRANATDSKELQVSVKGSSNLGARELANWVLPHLKFNLGGGR